MGGHAAGEVASRIGVETILSCYYGDDDDERPAALERAFVQANSAIHDQGRGKMGTTGVAALLYHDALHIANVGDSRAYLIREGTIKQISRDHSFVSDQVAAGLISPEEARVSPVRNVITRALGHQPEVLVDLYRFPVQVGDAVLLASDGLHGQVADDEIAQMVGEHATDEAVSQLIDLANDRGGPDNITVVLTQVESLDWDAELLDDEDEAQADPPEEAPESDAPAPVDTPPAAVALPAPEPPASEPAAPPASPPSPPSASRRLTLLGGLLATVLFTALVAVIVWTVSQSAPAANPALTPIAVPTATSAAPPTPAATPGH
jgi:protein phosphatase